MKTKYLLIPLLLFASCNKGDDPEQIVFPDSGPVEHEMIVLGEQLEDPYSVANVTKALATLYPTKAGRTDVSATDLYVRFLPKNDDEFSRLLALGLDLSDHPCDYRILKEGDYYHDPSLSDDTITWQYAVVPTGFSFPEGIKAEVLDNCFISEHAVTRAGFDDEVDWAAVERLSFIQTGNGDLLQPETRAESFAPEGRITIVDDEYAGGKPIGVSGVKVVCNSFVKFATAYTDRDGYYRMGRKFSSNVRYRILFKNEKKFSLGVNLILVPASVSTLGTGNPEGVDFNVTKESDRKLFTRCVVNNAIYDYITRCSTEDMDIKTPPTDLRIWIFQKLSSSSTMMLHHGAVVDAVMLGQYLEIYKDLIKHFSPDVTIGVKDHETYGDIYRAAVHEMAHCSHYASVGNGYWNHFIKYIILSYIGTGGQTYGNGTGSDAGYCEVGECWAYYMENVLSMERYGGPMPSYGTSYWFYPQIFRYLEERGLTRAMLFRALTAETVSKEALHARLVDLYPEYTSAIDQVFARYSN